MIGLVLFTLTVGIALDAKGPAWGQAAVSAWTWAALLTVGWLSSPRHRLELFSCLLFAWLGELFLGTAWGLYQYRLGNLPLFIPPGHALVFAAGVRMAHHAPRWLPWAVAAIAGPYIATATLAGFDTSGGLWFVVWLGFLAWGRDRQLYGVMFVFALLIEIYGTSIGGWRYFHDLPHVGLTSTNPPSCAGVFYCILDVLVLAATRALRPLEAT